MTETDKPKWIKQYLNLTIPPPGSLDTTRPAPGIATEMSDVTTYLREHKLQRTAKKMMLDGQVISIADAVQTAIHDLHLTAAPQQVHNWVKNAADSAELFKPKEEEGGPQKAPGADFSLPVPTYSLSYALVPWTGHVDTKTAKTAADPVQHQLAFGATIALHADGKAGVELSWQVQVTGSGDSFKVASVLQGPQAAWVVPFLDGALQLSALASALAGMAAGAPGENGVIPHLETVQLGIGGQITYAIPGTKNHLLLGAQVAASITAQKGSNATVDAAPQIFLQFQW